MRLAQTDVAGALDVATRVQRATNVRLIIVLEWLIRGQKMCADE